MNPNNLIKGIIATYKTSQPIYGNKEYVFGNMNPVFPPYPKLYNAFVWLRNERLDLYEKLCYAIEAGIETGTFVVVLEEAKDIVPDEYKPALATLIIFVTFYNARNKEKTADSKEGKA